MRSIKQIAFLNFIGRASIAATLAAGAFALTTVSSHAAPSGLNTYDVTGIFEDGGDLGGYFQYDPTTSTFGTFDLTTTATTNTSILDSYSGTSNVLFSGYNYNNTDASPSGNGVSDHVQFDTSIGGLGLPGELAYLPTSPGIDDNLAYSTGATEWNQLGGRTLSSGYLSLAGTAPEISSASIMTILLALGAPLAMLSRKRAQNRA